MAGEAAVQVVPVPERGRGAGRLPHGWLGSTPPSARAFAWPGTRAQPPRPPAVLGAATPRPLLWFGSAVAAPGRAHRPRASDGRVQFPSREPAAAETKGKSFRARAAPYPWRYCRGSVGGRPPPSGGIWEQPRHKGCGPAPQTEALECPRLLRCHQPPKPVARAEYSDLPAHCEAPCPFIIPLHDLSQTINTSRPGSSLGAEDSQMSGAWFTG